MLIRWSEPAVRDLTHICDYIEEHSGPATARRIAMSIHHSLQNLAEFPELGRTGRKPDTRELVFTGLPYIAIYQLLEDAVIILRILHGAQIWP